ncbi:hypothetical protein BKA69DRAFT_1107219 [Paraphysoderma sedebokerense]|nr:hypothetical protein BKA69DRAFT_1107219 [Paraphysoderma sedebokerense]
MRDVAVSEFITSFPGKLHPDDDWLPRLLATMNFTCSETKEKLSAMQQKLENLKGHQVMLQQNPGVGSDRLECVICAEFKDEFMAAECGHLCCSGCSATMSTCYVCKKRADWKRILL